CHRTDEQRDRKPEEDASHVQASRLMRGKVTTEALALRPEPGLSFSIMTKRETLLESIQFPVLGSREISMRKLPSGSPMKRGDDMVTVEAPPDRSSASASCHQRAVKRGPVRT